MIALALIILLLAVLLSAAILSDSAGSLALDLFGVEVTTSVAGLYLTGLVTGLATLLAVGLLRTGLKKSWRRRKHVRELQRRTEVAEEHERQVVTAEPMADSPDETQPARRLGDDDG